MADDNKKGKAIRKRVDSAFAKNLQQLMKDHNLSLRKVAEICKVNPASVHAWLQGGAPQDLSAVLRLCQTVSCDFQHLLTGTHGTTDVNNLTLSQIFEIEKDPTFSGLFMLEAKRLKRKGK